jgi:hypothetical protein
MSFFKLDGVRTQQQRPASASSQSQPAQAKRSAPLVPAEAMTAGMSSSGVTTSEASLVEVRSGFGHVFSLHQPSKPPVNRSASPLIGAG